MYDHEKALFEAAITSKKTNPNFIYSMFFIVFIMSVWMFVELLTIRLYLSIWLVIYVLLFILFIKRQRQMNEKTKKESYQKFLELFYQVMIKNHPIYEEYPLQVITHNQLNVSPRIVTDVLDDDKRYVHIATLHHLFLQIEFVDVFMNQRQIQRKIILTTRHLDDLAFECRSLKKPEKQYEYHMNVRGYHVFTNDRKAIKPYLNLFDKMRVHPLIDQLDVTFREDVYVASYKLAKTKVPNHVKPIKKYIPIHETYVNDMLDTVHHIMSHLKEMQQ